MNELKTSWSDPDERRPAVVVDSYFTKPGDVVTFKAPGVSVVNVGNGPDAIFLRADGLIVSDHTPIVSSPMTADVATWISKNVLTRPYLKSCGGVKLVRSCQCQYGECGHCGAGEHTKCTTWVSFDGTPPAAPLAHILGRKGGVLASVLPTGKACRWICSCSTCRESRPVKPEPKAIAYRRATGPLRPEDTVWLTPKTLGCPAICWKQPRATVVNTAGVYVTVRIDGTQHRIHQDNILRAEPGTVAPRKPRPVKPTRPMLAGFEEQSLF